MKKTQIFVFVTLVAIVIGWLITALTTTQFERPQSQEYSSQDFSEEFESVATVVEKIIIQTNERHSFYYSATRILVAVGAVIGIISAAIAALNSENKQTRSRLSGVFAVMFGVASAAIPLSIGWASSEADESLIRAKELERDFVDLVEEVRLDKSMEPEATVQLRALIARYGGRA